MKKRSTLKYIKLDDLKLDLNNPRFGELYSGSSNEEDLIQYLLSEEAAEEIAKAIVKTNEFYEDKALWVIQDSDKKFIVRDGNRRCAAVKALQMPGKFELDCPKTIISQLPVYEYTDEEELKLRIGEEHAASLFRSWERIAKAFQILDLADSGKHDLMNSLDSKPGDFIKLGSFYREAVKIGGNEFRRQLRRGRGKSGGKTVIYERLFRDAKLCGYKFKNSPSYKIEITNQQIFDSYIKALVDYVEAHPDLKAKDLDAKKDFIKELKDFGFDAYKKSTPTPQVGTGTGNIGAGNTGTGSVPHGTTPAGTPATGSSGTGSTSPGGSSTSGVPASPSGNPSGTGTSGGKRGSIKKTADIKRKKLPSGLKARIDEYFALDSATMPNAKIAMARVTYECILKYVVDHTKSGKIIFKNSGHFGSAYGKKTFVNFDELNRKFVDLISDVGKKNAFTVFEFEKMHQIIHNYDVSGRTNVADQIRDNLVPLIEFMLQDQNDLLNSLEISKIR